MPEVLLDGRGSGNFAGITEANRLMVDVSGTVNANILGSIIIGSVSAHVDSIYVQSGTLFVSSGNVAVTNLSDLGSSRVITNFSDLGSSRVIAAGSILEYEVNPNDAARNNPLNKFLYVTSGTATGVTGSEIGSIVQFIGAGSFVQVFTWSNDLITQIGSWS